jgi:molecular chaperone DnaK
VSTRLGVDLGTTWTAAALGRNGTTESVVLEGGNTAMPSVVAFSNGDVLAGSAAEMALAKNASSGAREFKRRFGDTTPLVIDGTPYGAEALMARILETVVASAEGMAGEPIGTVVLTHPANWGEYKLELLRDVGRLAGLDDVELMSEPGAAALHYAGLDKLPVGGVAVIYDFGGGTFDAAVVRVESDGAQLLGTPEGLERLGGVDFDQVVFAHVNAALGGALGEADTTDPDVRSAVMDLRAECTRAKEALSTDTETTIPVRLPGLTTDVRMTREEFEAGIRPRLADTLAALDRAVASAGVPMTDVEGVLLVGGTSRIPLVAEIVGSHTGRPLLSEADRKQVVVLGAAGGDAIQTDAPAAGAEVPAPPVTSKSATKPSESVSKKRGVPQLGLAARAAAAAGVAGVAGVGGYAAWRLLADEDDGNDVAPELNPDPYFNPDPEGIAVSGSARQPIVRDGSNVGDEPLDAFDQPARGVAVFTGTPQGRVTNAVFRAAVDEPSAVRPLPPPPAPIRSPAEQHVPSSPASITGEDPEIESVRAQLAERLEGFHPPEGSDPEDAAKLKADLEGLLERYQPYPGQSVEDAVATLRYEFEDRVRDFAQDQRIEAVIAEQEQQILEAQELEVKVDEFKEQLSERLDGWQPPEGADPEEAAELKADLEAMLDRYVAVPGQSPEDALAELRYRFNDEVGDFAQDLRIDALVEELRDDDEADDEADSDATDQEPVSDDATVDDDDETDSRDTTGEEDGPVPADDSTDEALANMETVVVAELERLRENFDRETLVARPTEEMEQLTADRTAAEARLEDIRQARLSTDPAIGEALVASREIEYVPGTGVVADTVIADPAPDAAAPVVVDVFDEIVDDDMTVMTAPGDRTVEDSVSGADAETVVEAEALSSEEATADRPGTDAFDDVMGTEALDDAVSLDEGPSPDREVPTDVETPVAEEVQADLVDESENLLGVVSEDIPDVDAEILAEDIAEADVLTEDIPDVDAEILAEDVAEADVLTEDIPDFDADVSTDDDVMGMSADPTDNFAVTELDDANDDV